MPACLQVDAVKRNCLKVLPHTLVIHLKRFEFDYETMTRWKIKDRRAMAACPCTASPCCLPCSACACNLVSPMRTGLGRPACALHRFEFPQELDMYKYTVDGLAAREAADAVAAAAAASEAAAAGPSGAAEGAADAPGTPKLPLPNARQYQYGLKGIVVHSGSAFAGHYYSYIKVCVVQCRRCCTPPEQIGGITQDSHFIAQVRKQAGQGLGADQWFCFDDNQVRCCSVWGGLTASASFSYPHSASTAGPIGCPGMSPGGALGPSQPGPRLLRRQAVRGAPG